jgi:putative transposase
MKASRFSEEQIIGILREHEAGAKTPDICRRHGISDATFYKWKAKYGGLEVSEARRLKALEDENRRLKKLLAEAMLDNAALKAINTRALTNSMHYPGPFGTLRCSSRRQARAESPFENISAA